MVEYNVHRRSSYRQKDVSVIIVNYNVKDFLQQTLLSLQKSLKNLSFEIIVIDNASDDGSAAMVRQKYPGVILIENTENVGFARANNQAFKRARGKYIFLLNPDTLVQENTVRVLYDFMESHPDAGAIGCKILNPDGSLQLSCRRSIPTPWVAFTKIIGLSSLFPRSRIFGRYNLTFLDPNETYIVEALSGSCMFVRREVYEHLGGFDETFYMYGEDLDFCYRIRKAGWNLYYVHTTQIVHYKGESTKRSSIDERKVFYEAMRIFVEKHFNFVPLLVILLKISIAYISLTARILSLVRNYSVAVLDASFLFVSLLLAEYIRKGEIFTFPHGVLLVYTIPIISTLSVLGLLGVYTKRRFSITHSAVSVLISYVCIAALTAFFKEYAFSRAIIIYAGTFSLILLPLWRLVARLYQGKKSNRVLWQRRALVVGTGRSACELVQRIRYNPAVGIDIKGFVNTTHKNIGKKIFDLPILCSVEALYKTVVEQSVTDIIFAPKSLEYEKILTIISQNPKKDIVFHIVPSSLEVMIGKANVELLDDIPIIEISYNISKPLNKFIKRLFDISFSLLLLVTVYPIFIILAKNGRTSVFRYLPKVLTGEYSFVGREIENSKNNTARSTIYLGKQGLTGIVQLFSDKKLSFKEKEQYELYYARNQSLYLDIEILVKTFLQTIYRRKREVK
ncbi:MAG: glycosyltransferase [Bacteroidetes bacterium]|nr:glycosyltransferase [Bacteroidota bacterium]